jgi:hypothetical protein
MTRILVFINTFDIRKYNLSRRLDEVRHRSETCNDELVRRRDEVEKRQADTSK